MFCRRANALVALGRAEEGLQDLNTALAILPLNQQIRTDRDNLQNLIHAKEEDKDEEEEEEEKKKKD